MSLHQILKRKDVEELRSVAEKLQIDRCPEVEKSDLIAKLMQAEPGVLMKELHVSWRDVYKREIKVFGTILFVLLIIVSIVLFFNANYFGWFIRNGDEGLTVQLISEKNIPLPNAMLQITSKNGVLSRLSDPSGIMRFSPSERNKFLTSDSLLAAEILWMMRVSDFKRLLLENRNNVQLKFEPMLISTLWKEFEAMADGLAKNPNAFTVWKKERENGNIIKGIQTRHKGITKAQIRAEVSALSRFQNSGADPMLIRDVSNLLSLMLDNDTLISNQFDNLFFKLGQMADSLNMQSAGNFYTASLLCEEIASESEDASRAVLSVQWKITHAITVVDPITERTFWDEAVRKLKSAYQKRDVAEGAAFSALDAAIRLKQWEHLNGFEDSAAWSLEEVLDAADALFSELISNEPIRSRAAAVFVGNYTTVHIPILSTRVDFDGNSTYNQAIKVFEVLRNGWPYLAADVAFNLAKERESRELRYDAKIWYERAIEMRQLVGDDVGEARATIGLCLNSLLYLSNAQITPSLRQVDVASKLLATLEETLPLLTAETVGERVALEYRGNLASAQLALWRIHHSAGDPKKEEQSILRNAMQTVSSMREEYERQENTVELYRHDIKFILLDAEILRVMEDSWRVEEGMIQLINRQQECVEWSMRTNASDVDELIYNVVAVVQYVYTINGKPLPARVCKELKELIDLRRAALELPPMSSRLMNVLGDPAIDCIW